MPAHPNILLVDDDPVVLQTLAPVLTRMLSASVATSESGEWATQLCEEARFDLVIADYMLGGMSGLDVLGRLHAVQPEAKRVLLTGHREALAGALDSSVTLHAVIGKPYSLKRIRRTLLEVLEGTRPAMPLLRLQQRRWN
jgi:CheY-like chemotaxis protein